MQREIWGHYRSESETPPNIGGITTYKKKRKDNKDCYHYRNLRWIDLQSQKAPENMNPPWKFEFFSLQNVFLLSKIVQPSKNHVSGLNKHVLGFLSFWASLHVMPSLLRVMPCSRHVIPCNAFPITGNALFQACYYA